LAYLLMVSKTHPAFLSQRENKIPLPFVYRHNR
jgi:hypothetical protein